MANQKGAGSVLEKACMLVVLDFNLTAVAGSGNGVSYKPPQAAQIFLHCRFFLPQGDS